MIIKHNKTAAVALLAMVMLASIQFITGCKSAVSVISPEKQADVIDLNQIEMVSRQESEKALYVKQDENGNYYVKFNLQYSKSGINVIQAIKSGKIIFHQIVIMSADGRKIGSDSINFHSFDVTLSDTKSIIQDDKGRKDITRSKQQKPPELESVEYGDNDQVPQIIGLDKPEINTYVAIFIELWYIQPYFGDICYSGQSDVIESSRIDRVFDRLKKENNTKLKKMRDDYQEALDTKLKDGVRLTTKNLPVIPKFPSYKKGDPQIMQLEEEMRKTIDDLNGRYKSPTLPLKDNADKYNNTADFGNKLYFRVWKLISIPKYYKLVR
jgi:hypothetical protein